MVDYTVNDRVKVVYASDDRMEIVVNTVLDSYDPDLCERMLSNPNSYFFDGYQVNSGVFSNIESRHKLIRAIFGSDAKLAIKVCAHYKLYFNGHVDVSDRHYDYQRECKDYLVNPHYYFFRCIGFHYFDITKALLVGNYTLATNWCSHAARFIDINDKATVKLFMEQLFNSKNKVILMPDGSSCTPAEALSWLNEQERL